MMSDDLRKELRESNQPREILMTTPVKPSVAQIMGHAIHPILVAFPIVLYSIATACFIAYNVNAETFWFRAAFYASFCGVIAAVIAAVPGLTDYLGSIPARDPAKKVGLTHAAFNVLSLALYSSVVVLLWNTVSPEGLRVEVVDAVTPMWLSIIGLLSTLVAGYYGGSLVQQYHVGVEPSPYPQVTHRVRTT